MNRGVYTVETAVIMGMILIIITMLMSLMFVLHDKNVFMAMEQYYLREASGADNEAEKWLACSRFVSETNSWTYYLKADNVGVDETEDGIVLTYRISLRGLNKTAFSFWTGDFLSEMKTSRMPTTKSGADFVRLAHGLVFRNEK